MKINRLVKKYIHHCIVKYLKKCGGAFHSHPYGDSGRYVVLMDESKYHRYTMAEDERSDIIQGHYP